MNSTEHGNALSVYSYDSLFLNRNNFNSDLEVKLLKIENSNDPDEIIYNGGLFTLNNKLYLVARTECLDEEVSNTKIYQYQDNRFVLDSFFVALNNLQDPSPFYHPDHGVAISLVKTIPDKNDRKSISKYRSIIYPLNNFSKTADQKMILAKGPYRQKGLKIFFYNGAFLVTARNRFESEINDIKKVKSSNHLSLVSKVEDINPKFIKNILKKPDTTIKNFFAADEWGNVTDCMLELEDGKIAFMGHIAKYVGNEKYYSIIAGILDPQTLVASEVSMILTAKDILKIYPDLPPKRNDLYNVVYPRSIGFCFDQDKLFLIGSCGLEDRYSIIFKLNWPFSVGPKQNHASNQMFNYSADLIQKIFSD